MMYIVICTCLALLVSCHMLRYHPTLASGNVSLCTGANNFLVDVYIVVNLILPLVKYYILGNKHYILLMPNHSHPLQ